MYAIEVNNLTKTYTRNRKIERAVSNVSFALPEGKTLGFIGANGAGKSTTIKCILDFVKPSGGNISLFGLPSSDYRSRKNLAYVAEKPIINDLLTPSEVLTLSLAYYKDRLRPSKNSCEFWLERLGVAAAASKPMRALSKGMQQRVALAAALVVEPRLLILDEPLSGLDPIGRLDVVNILDEYAQQGGSLMFTSHVLHDVERLADYYAIINKGVLTVFQTREELKTKTDYLISYENNQSVVEKLVVPLDQLESAIGRLYGDGHKILLVKPELDLERLFYTMVSK